MCQSAHHCHTLCWTTQPYCWNMRKHLPSHFASTHKTRSLLADSLVLVQKFLVWRLHISKTTDVHCMSQFLDDDLLPLLMHSVWNILAGLSSWNNLHIGTHHTNQTTWRILVQMFSMCLSNHILANFSGQVCLCPIPGGQLVAVLLVAYELHLVEVVEWLLQVTRQYLLLNLILLIVHAWIWISQSLIFRLF